MTRRSSSIGSVLLARLLSVRGRRQPGMRAADPVERLLRGARLRRVRRDVEHLLKRLGGAVEILLPNARTMPTFSSVFECFGSIASERSNCASARSGWFV